MSTCISSIMSHKWPTFSLEFVENVVRAIRPGSGASYKLISESGSANQDFVNNHFVLFSVSDGFSLRFGQKILGVNFDERWSIFLIQKGSRERVISVFNRIASVARSREALLLPGGTILEDAFFDGVDFNEVKKRALKCWGSADLDIGKLYAEDELSMLGHDRVHYFVISGED
jgi:hypothetical protein